MSGETKPVSVATLQKGNYVIIEGVACRVSDTQTSRPGKHGHAKVRLTGVGLLDDKKRVIVMPGHDNIDSPIVEKRSAQVLSIHGNVANIMDAETYETFDLPIPDELKTECVEGCNILYWVVLDSKVMKQVKQQ
ncbi:TPA: translation initiation factor IF-5A [Candidatus Woesearchaeota archaeon]|nr:translation initiation factor IF-5A [Candidatus Woesearchaeota archaeon]